MQAALQGVTTDVMQDVGQWKSKASFLSYADQDQLDAALAEREVHSVRKKQKCETERRQSDGSSPSSTEESSSGSDGS